ncbi:MAG: L-aspartate oxidase [Aquamicrobium sp.]|uniref:L-aspartate oxidase n=1 Tax=Mesorhizobium sp. Pch-S TaxID=2082387 RepID=UPI0010101FAC|nr:L-aspartate oxidase [Mesorhizobium sp. Pch-S]MBR2689052.1 L-aspartate oxidase [Aquamicrobium sp.]QAZ43531.1 L-aspartate oxidase [Mesorhizobium sp. Pch-S]
MKPSIDDLQGRPVIVGSGVAGLMAALCLAPEPVVLISSAPLGTETSSMLAQGGMAASLGSDDNPELHLADTLGAGAGLCDEAVVRRFVGAAPAAIASLERLGVMFDRAPDGSLRLGLEAAHARRRIVHAAGDATGRELVRALAVAVRQTSSITLLEGVEVRRLLIEDGAIAGVVVVGGSDVFALSSGRVVLATGGVGGLFDNTTNPSGSVGQGLALAARTGAVLADLEFVQFHPTALDVPHRPMPLISEAVRGEGAVLVDEDGHRFLADTPGGELAPRDVVARAVWRELAAGRRVFLDTRQCLGSRFAGRFPAIEALCRKAGIDPSVQPIPVRPAAHYHMGGVAVDAEGRSSVAGLWACGEVACTGLHGANRLASNSLTEAVVSAVQVASSVASSARRVRRYPIAVSASPTPDAAQVRSIVSGALGIVRDEAPLRDAVAALLPFTEPDGVASDPAIVGLMIAVAALRREESRGAHCRADFPLQESQPRRSRLTLAETLDSAAAITEMAVPLIRRA